MTNAFRSDRAGIETVVACKTSNLFLASATVVILASIASIAPAHAGTINLPNDVLEFIQRRSTCREWSKKASDPETAAQIEALTLSLRCSNIERDEQKLRKSYADNPNVIANLDATWIKIVKRIGTTTSIGTRPSDFDH